MSAENEMGAELNLKFDAGGLITAVTVDADTGEVLMVAHMNLQALEHTLATGNATYWSRSRKKLWVKGEESGHVQRVQAVLVDCDQDAVVIKVKQEGVACHNGFRSCFYRAIEPHGKLRMIRERQADPAAIYGKK